MEGKAEHTLTRLFSAPRERLSVPAEASSASARPGRLCGERGATKTERCQEAFTKKTLS